MYQVKGKGYLLWNQIVHLPTNLESEDDKKILVYDRNLHKTKRITDQQAL